MRRSSTRPFDSLRRSGGGSSNRLVCPPLSQQQRSAGTPWPRSFSSSASSSSSAPAWPNGRPVRSRGVPPVTFPPASASPSSPPPVPLLSTIPPHILRPPYARPPFAPPPNLFAAETDPASSDPMMMMMLWPRSQEELQQLRRVCRQAKRLLRLACRWVRERGEGSTTAALDAAVREAIVVGGGAAAAAAYPSPLGYKGFPRAICTSVNEVACHGVPFEGRKLRRGDLVHIDLTIYAEGTEEEDETKKRRRSNEAEEEERGGWHGDCSRTVVVGGEYLDEQSRELVEANEEALRKAIAAVRPGMRANAIGEIIAGVAEEHGFSIVKEVCGHGIGRHFHAPPTIPHFRTNMSSSVVLHPGMVFTIEPIFCEGSGEVWLCEDGWSIATKDGGWSAAAEDTILVTEDGAEVLTSSEEE